MSWFWQEVMLLLSRIVTISFLLVLWTIVDHSIWNESPLITLFICPSVDDTSKHNPFFIDRVETCRSFYRLISVPRPTPWHLPFKYPLLYSPFTPKTDLSVVWRMISVQSYQSIVYPLPPPTLWTSLYLPLTYTLYSLSTIWLNVTCYVSTCTFGFSVSAELFYQVSLGSSQISSSLRNSD